MTISAFSVKLTTRKRRRTSLLSLFSSLSKVSRRSSSLPPSAVPLISSSPIRLFGRRLTRRSSTGWKSLILADAPRQVINGITLYSFGASEDWSANFADYHGGSGLKGAIILTMLFTLVIWAGSMILLLVAAFMYVPLLCYIQGNLKEYCAAKCDKRFVPCSRFSTEWSS